MDVIDRLTIYLKNGREVQVQSDLIANLKMHGSDDVYYKMDEDTACHMSCIEYFDIEINKQLNAHYAFLREDLFTRIIKGQDIVAVEITYKPRGTFAKIKKPKTEMLYVKWSPKDPYKNSYQTAKLTENGNLRVTIDMKGFIEDNLIHEEEIAS